MKYYSEELKRLFDSEEELKEEETKVLEAKKKAEEEKEKLAAERKARAAEVDEARKAMVEAQNNYQKVLGDFLRDYKTYHYSTSNIEDMPKLFNYMDSIFKW
mgnify:CR=1 FL=1